MKFRQGVITITLLLIGICSSVFFWDNTFLILIVLSVCSLIKHLLYPIQREFLQFFIFALIGGAVSMFILTNGDWNEITNEITISLIWMPLFWGFIGITATSFISTLPDKLI